MIQEELNSVRAHALFGLQSAKELLTNGCKDCSPSLVKNIIQTISQSYSSLLTPRFGENEKEEDERVRFLVDEMKIYLDQL